MSNLQGIRMFWYDVVTHCFVTSLIYLPIFGHASRVLENLIVAQLIKTFPAFYESRSFFTVFRRASHWSNIVSQMNPIYTSTPLISRRQILIIFFRLYLDRPSDLFQLINLLGIPNPIKVRHITSPSQNIPITYTVIPYIFRFLCGFPMQTVPTVGLWEWNPRWSVEVLLTNHVNCASKILDVISYGHHRSEISPKLLQSVSSPFYK